MVKSMSENHDKKIKNIVAELEKRKTSYKSQKDRTIKRFLRRTLRKSIMLFAVVLIIIAFVFLTF